MIKGDKMETTNRYANGKIYRLVNDKDNCEYVGSTCSTLSKRLFRHKMKSHSLPNMKVYNHILKIGGWNQVKIILIEEYPCNNKMELLRRERYWIEEREPVLNSKTPTRTGEEWRVENKEQIVENDKLYYQNNKDKIKERSRNYHHKNKERIDEARSQIITCSCGAEIQKRYISKHSKTPKHLKRLEEL